MSSSRASRASTGRRRHARPGSGGPARTSARTRTRSAGGGGGEARRRERSRRAIRAARASRTRRRWGDTRTAGVRGARPAINVVTAGSEENTSGARTPARQVAANECRFSRAFRFVRRKSPPRRPVGTSRGKTLPRAAFVSVVFSRARSPPRGAGARRRPLAMSPSASDDAAPFPLAKKARRARTSPRRRGAHGRRNRPAPTRPRTSACSGAPRAGVRSTACSARRPSSSGVSAQPPHVGPSPPRRRTSPRRTSAGAPGRRSRRCVRDPLVAPEAKHHAQASYHARWGHSTRSCRGCWLAAGHCVCARLVSVDIAPHRVVVYAHHTEFGRGSSPGLAARVSAPTSSSPATATTRRRSRGCASETKEGSPSCGRATRWTSGNSCGTPPRTSANARAAAKKRSGAIGATTGPRARRAREMSHSCAPAPGREGSSSSPSTGRGSARGRCSRGSLRGSRACASPPRRSDRSRAAAARLRRLFWRPFESSTPRRTRRSEARRARSRRWWR